MTHLSRRVALRPTDGVAPVADVRPRLVVVPSSVALPVLALLAAVVSLANLTVSGYANTYYSLAAQAASRSWSAMFFGSLDAANFVTLDKPPLATWLMGLSVRLFGLSSWSILLPEAALGAATVVVLYLAVRRSFGSTAAAIAGAVMALTPVAVVIFRYNNPDALLTFLLVTAAWALGRGLEAGRLRWALLAAGLVGAAFLTKFLQAYLVLPAFALAWLVSGPGPVRKRIGGLVASLVVVLVSSGWWVAIVELIPASSRPYIGGSTHNSVLQLIFGYDGLGRIFGEGGARAGASGGLASGGAGGTGGPGGGGGFGGQPGLFRLFNGQMAGQIAWLLPAGLGAVATGAGMQWRRARTARTDRRVAVYVLWGTWLLVHLTVFSFMSGIIHSYYTVIMVPAIAALVGAAATELWAVRDQAWARATLAVGLVVTGLTSAILLTRTPAFVPGLGIAAVALALAAALILVIPTGLVDARIRRAGIAIALVAALAGPLAYDVSTIATAHSGGDVAAGPQGDGVTGPRGETVGPSALTSYLLANRGSATWIVAVEGSQSAAQIQLATQQPVMSMGGFNGSDPPPSLARLKADIASGALRFVLLDGGFRNGGPGGAPSVSAATNASWIAGNCQSVTISGSGVTSLYDCAGAAG